MYSTVVVTTVYYAIPMLHHVTHTHIHNYVTSPHVVCGHPPTHIHTHTHAPTHTLTHTRAYTHAYTHTHTHAQLHHVTSHTCYEQDHTV